MYAKTVAWCFILLFGLVSVAVFAAETAAPSKPERPASLYYCQAKAYHIPPETNTEESGYFALCEGKNGKIYLGTAAYARDAYLVEFDPATEAMKVVLDANKVLGLPLEPTGYAAQAKIHTRLYVGPSGTIYLGTMMGYPTPEEWKSGKIPNYPGGYVMTYDPATGVAKNLGMPLPLGDTRQLVWPPPTQGQGVIDVVADEQRGLIYVVTVNDHLWMLYDTAHPEKKFRHLGVMLANTQPNTLLDRKGRATAITRDFQVARYDPATGGVTIDELLIDGTPFREVVGRDAQCPDWRLAADGKTAYLQMLNDLRLFQIDLSGRAGRPVRGRSLGNRVEGKHPDSRGSIAIGPDGNVYSTIRIDNETGFGNGGFHHLVCYNPRAKAMRDLGVYAVSNPGYFDFTGPQATNPDGSLRPRSGFQVLPDGTLTPQHAMLALLVAHDGTIYATTLYPFTLLRISPPGGAIKK